MKRSTMKGKLTLTVILLSVTLVSSVNALGHGETCDESVSDASKRCDPGLTCIYLKCSCVTGEGFEYDAAQKRCVAQIGASCGSDGDCVTGGKCVDLFCECKEGLLATKDHHCSKPYGANCTNSAECSKDRNMVCAKGESGRMVCKCENDKEQLFQDADDDDDDEEGNPGPLRGGFCNARVGQFCDPSLDTSGFPNGYTGEKCILGAVCERAANLTYTCNCPEGTSVSSEKTCSNGSISTLTTTNFGIYSIISFVGLYMSWSTMK